MDESLRELVRRVQAAPDDERLRIQLRRERERLGLLPRVGDYVRLDGALVGRLDLSGNWRIHLGRGRLGHARGVVAEFVLTLISPVRETVAHALTSATEDEIVGARVPFDAPVTLAEPSIRVPCAKCLTREGHPCRSPSRERDKPHLGRIHVPPLEPPPPPLPVLVGPPRQRESLVKVVESRSPDADVRITPEDLIEKKSADT